MIRLENIEKCYGDRCVLNGIDLSVEKGDFIAVMGSSGSGKSTLLNLIGGMDIPDRGRIIVDGEEISLSTDEKLTLYRRKKVGFIFQFFNLLPNITVFENIEMPLLLNETGDYKARVLQIMKEVGLGGKERSYPFQLSGGEQQRVAIARALIHKPELILADEPTGNLDSTTGNSVMSLIKDMAEGTRKTVVLVTHDHSIADFAQRIIKIRDGKLQQ
jgi:putative ABC transport system ATP-binding protein